MKTKHAILSSGLVLLLLAGFALAQDAPRREPKANEAATVKAPPAATATNRPAGSALPVVGYIERRGETITIKAGPKGPLYSVQDAQGKVRHENLSAEQLRAKAPELHEFLKTAVAGSNGKGAVMDASLQADRPR